MVHRHYSAFAYFWWKVGELRITGCFIGERDEADSDMLLGGI
jgi:hypothetical protein